jgi:biofilm PGA synthesis lipoprotein PgaB
MDRPYPLIHYAFLTARRYTQCVLVGLWLVALGQAGAAELPSDGRHFLALVYHDVTRDRSTLEVDGIMLGDLVAHFDFLRAEGYNVISMQDLFDARERGRPLPPRAVLLTFDDGRISVYRYVFPLLRAYGYPAVIALVGAWMDTPAGGTIEYGAHPLPRDQFVTWPQVREMQASGLVEVATHSYDMHRGLLANREGSMIAAALVRQYDPTTASYESLPHYQARLAADMQRAVASLEQGSGRRPRVMVWPYGSFNGAGLDAAQAAGLTATLTTEEEAASVEHLERIGRVTLFRSPGVGALATSVKIPARTPLFRALRIPIERLATGDETEDERRLGLLLDRLRQSQPSVVVVEGFTQDAQGRWAAHFPTDVLPNATSRCLRIGWQIRSRIDVDVIIAAVPWRGLTEQLGHDRTRLRQLMRDLGWALPFDGVVFTDFSWLAALPAHRLSHPSTQYWPGDSSAARARARRRVLQLADLSQELQTAVDGLTELQYWRPRALLSERLEADPVGQWKQHAAHANAQLFDYVLIAHPPQFQQGEAARFIAALQALRRSDEVGAEGRFGVMLQPWTTRANPWSAERFFRRLGAADTRHFGLAPLEWDTPLEQIDILSRELSQRTYPFLP